MTNGRTDTVIETVDTLSGERIEYAELTVRRVVRLNCGCKRYECERPGGGDVHVIRGACCEAKR